MSERKMETESNSKEERRRTVGERQTNGESGRLQYAKRDEV